MPPSVQDEVRARSARKSQKEIHSTTYTLQPHRQRSPACAATFTLSCPPALPPAGIAAGTEPAAACALARVPRMECERTSGQRSRQPRQHSRRLRPRGANCGHCRCLNIAKNNRKNHRPADIFFHRPSSPAGARENTPRLLGASVLAAQGLLLQRADSFNRNLGNWR